MARSSMSLPPEDYLAQNGDVVLAKRLLYDAIAILSTVGRHVSAAHAQMALDLLDEGSSRLDPQLPD